MAGNAHKARAVLRAAELQRLEGSSDMILMIDNYDSFTYNLVQYLGELGADVHVVRNDEITLDEIAALRARRASSSRPGPCTPNEAGISLDVIRALRGQDADPRRLPRPPGDRPGVRRQGRARAAQSCTARLSPIEHDGEGVFAGCPSPFEATRYHSLVDRARVAARLPRGHRAWTDDGEIMGVRHRTLPVEGVQFHPESILTEHGHGCCSNFLDIG